MLARILKLSLLGGSALFLKNRLQAAIHPFHFDGKTVVLTGGSRGLGLAIAQELLQYDVNLVICGRDEERLRKAEAQLTTKAKGRLLAIRCDVTQPEEVASLVERTIGAFSRVDVLINNAGQIVVGPLDTMTKDDYGGMLGVHFWGALHMVEAVLPSMRAARRGRIVNITSIGAKVAVPHMLPYSVSKFAAIGLSEGLRAELAEDGIKVTTVVPGLMRTGSPRLAQFKGQAAAEYTWFTVSDSLPLVSMSARSAARQILAACRRGQAEVCLSWPAKAASLAQGVAPGLTANIAAFVNRFLPKTNHLQTEPRPGFTNETRITRSVLTVLTRQAEKQYNQR